MQQILKILNSRPIWALSGAFSAVSLHATVSGQGIFAVSRESSGSGAMVLAVFLIFATVLGRIWIGIFNHSIVHDETIENVEKRQRKPYLPSMRTVAATVACTAGLFMLSLQTVGNIKPFDGPDGATKAAIFFFIIGVISIIAQAVTPRAKHYVFAFSVGTLITFILLGFHSMIFDASVRQDPFFMALGVICIVLVWKFMFGPWRPGVKATVLATFIFWIGMNMYLKESPTERDARVLATLIALVPALIWCVMFVKEHRQRIGLVVLMFFSGMLSTAPILFYDALVRNRVELQFFLFRIVPENFTHSTNAFVTGNLVGTTGIKSTLIATMISFLIVGCIEEVSKFWVLKKSGKGFFSSIDDVMQLGIIVAIGFAFAENVMNPSYFLSFVRSYLIQPETPEWGAFMGNILGRAILTNMVHILSTGVLAYFYGVALFASPVLEEEHMKGKRRVIPYTLLKIFRIPEKLTFRREKMIVGFSAAIALHGLFNFLVTVPDLLPGNPRTLGDLLGSAPGSPWHYVALLIIPSMFYVVGGFWILSLLFYNKDNMKERGVIVEMDSFVPQQKFYSQYL